MTRTEIKGSNLFMRKQYRVFFSGILLFFSTILGSMAFNLIWQAYPSPISLYSAVLICLAFTVAITALGLMIIWRGAIDRQNTNHVKGEGALPHHPFNIKSNDLVIRMSKAQLLRLFTTISTQQNNLRKQLKHKQHRYALDRISANIARIENCLDNLIDYSEMDQGSFEIKTTTSNIRESLTAILEKYKRNAPIYNTTFSYELDPHIPQYGALDIRLIQHILNNAMQIIHQYGHSNEVMLSVNDKQISADTHALKFYILNQNTEGKIENLSIYQGFIAKDLHDYNEIDHEHLTMALTKEIVESLGGQIGYNMMPGQGIALWVELPYIPKDHRKMAERAHILPHIHDEDEPYSPLDPSGYSVLIADDHPVNIQYMHKVTNFMHFKMLDDAINGVEALKKYKQNKHEIIFMDCQMPNMDGYEATRKIRKIEKDNKLPPSTIIGVTSDTTHAARKKCIESGMDDMISKPVEREMISEIISKHLPGALTYLDTDPPLFSNRHETINGITADKNKPDIAATATDYNITPVNLSHLRTYTGGNASDEAYFFRLFIEQAKESIETLERTLDNHNDTEWSRTAHKLKGAAANLGAEQLAELCHIAEIHESSISEEDILNAIRIELTKVDEYLNQISLENSSKNATA